MSKLNQSLKNICERCCGKDNDVCPYFGKDKCPDYKVLKTAIQAMNVVKKKIFIKDDRSIVISVYRDMYPNEFETVKECFAEDKYNFWERLGK